MFAGKKVRTASPEVSAQSMSSRTAMNTVTVVAASPIAMFLSRTPGRSPKSCIMEPSRT